MGIFWSKNNQFNNYCIEHIDVDSDMLCDACHSNLPLSNYFENQKLESKNAYGKNIITVSGKMPKETKLEINEIGKEEANSLTNQLASNNVEIKSIENAYDISLIYNEEKFQPEDYNNSVKVKLSNLSLDSEKIYALLHIKDDGSTEILPVNILNNNELEFKARSFSVYILITVGTNTVTFNGDGNYTILDENRNEITDGASIADGTNFTFSVVPSDGYGVASVTSLYSSGDSAVTLYGGIRRMTGVIGSVSENLTVEITTVLAPKITVQPVTTKAMESTTATFTVTAENATTYYWQYRTSKEDYWKAVSGGTSATLNVSSVTKAMSGYEYRCLVGNASFTDTERIESDIAMLSVCQNPAYEQTTVARVKSIDDIIITTQPVSVKVLENNTATFTVSAVNASVYKWQYRESKNDYWKAAGSTSTTLNISSVTKDKSGYEYRCLVGDYVGHERVESDIAVLSVVQNPALMAPTTAQVLDPIIFTQNPISQKVVLGETATFTVDTDDTATYQWQSKANGDTAWKDVDDTIGSGYTTKTLTVDTSSMAIDENLNVTNNLSGTQFRVVAKKSSIQGYIEKSDPAILSVAQGEYVSEGIKVTPNVNNESVTVTLPDEERIYNGQSHKPTVTVKDGDTVLTLETDYEVTYGENINAGTGTITITGAGNYGGTRVVEFAISPATMTGNISITGIAQYGQTLTVDTSNVIPTGASFEYQWWYAESANATSGTEISDAKYITYNVAENMVGKYVGVTVKATAQNYTEKTYTAITTVVLELISYPPINFTASKGTNTNYITLTWDDNGNSQYVEYVIQVLNANGDWETLSTNAISPFVHEGLTENTAYEYNIRAYNDFRGYSDYVYTEGFTRQAAIDTDFIKDTTRPTFTNITASASSESINSNTTVNVSFESFDENYNLGETTLSADTIIIKVGDAIFENAIVDMTKVDVASGEKFTFNLTNIDGSGDLSLVVPIASVVDIVGNVNLEIEIPTGLFVNDLPPANVEKFKASGDSDLTIILTFDNPDPSNKVVLEELNASDNWVVISNDATSPFERTGLEPNTTHEYRVHTVSETGKVSEYAYTVGNTSFGGDYIIIRNDTIKPVLTYVGITPDDVYINSEDTLILTIDTTDANYYYNESNILPEDIIVMVSGEVNNDATSSITKVSTASGERYEISITNITGLGKLSVAVSGDSIIDKAGNGNIKTTFDLTPIVANGTITDDAPTVDIDENVLTVTNEQESIIEIVKVEYQYRELGETEFITVPSNIIEDTDADTYYEVRTVVTDIAGNVVPSQITTVKIEPMDNSKIAITADIEDFTSGDVNVTINYGGTHFTKEYSIDGTTWNVTTEDEITVKIKSNTTVYARLLDTKTSTDSVTYVVDNIDKEKPIIRKVVATPDGKANSKDLVATEIEDKGVSGVKGYYASTVLDLDIATWTEFTGTEFTHKVTENGTYYVWVIDNAGNISEAKIVIINNIAQAVTDVTIPSSIEVQVGERISIPMEYEGEPKDITYTSDNEDIVGVETYIRQIVGVSSGETTINITITNYDETTIEKTITVIVKPVILTAIVTANGEEYTGEWTNQDVEVILVANNVSPADYDAKVGKDGDWSDISGLVVNSITGKGEITYAEDFSGEVYYIGYNSDGNVITTETTGNVIKVDKTSPTIGRVNNDVRTNSMIVEILDATDDMSGIKEYEIGIYLDNELLATYKGESGEVTFSGLVSSTTYGIKYTITDNAGNTTESIDGGTFTTGEVITTVTYDYLTNGGESVTLESEERVAGTLIDLTVIATKTGYTFKGWARTPDGQVLTSIVMPEEDITLYAIFKDEAGPVVSDKDYETVDGELDIILKAEDDGSGVKDYAVTTDEGNPTEWLPATPDENGEIRIPVPGTNKYYVWIRDIDGNYVMYEQIAIKDIFAPIGTIDVSGDNYVNDLDYSNKQKVIIKITAEDNESAPEDIKVAIFNEVDYANLRSYSQIDWNLSYTDGGMQINDWETTAGDGLRRVYVIFKDKAGNISMTIKEIE